VPQIAARADRHVVVEKAVVGGRSVSRVRVLHEAERQDELARMLGGKVVSEATRRHAEDMLSRARRDTGDKKKPRKKSA
jgi:DNA repair protein RecN (Recombination protein N)